MDPWDPEVERCFGQQDKKFAVHETEQQAAFAWLTSLRQRKVGWKEAKKQIVEYLKSKDADRDQLLDETKRARKKLKPWLAG
jgi:hypothetical protein